MRYLLLLTVIGAGCVMPPGPNPGPGPEPIDNRKDRARVAHDDAVRFAHGLAETCEDALSRLGTEITDGNALNRFMGEANERRRYESFTPIHQVWQSDFGGDNWSIERARESLKAAAEGFRSVK